VSADSAYVPAVDPDTLDRDSAVTPMLEFIRASSGGRLLNMHLQMAASALVLDQYTAMRRAVGDHATLDRLSHAAVALAASASGNGDYTLAINAMLARRAGWTDLQVAAISDGRSCGDYRIDALLEVVRESAAGDGTVHDITWDSARQAGWTIEELVEAYGYIGLVSYCDRFVRYARTAFDLAFAATAS